MQPTDVDTLVDASLRALFGDGAAVERDGDTLVITPDPATLRPLPGVEPYRELPD